MTGIDASAVGVFTELGKLENRLSADDSFTLTRVEQEFTGQEMAHRINRRGGSSCPPSPRAPRTPAGGGGGPAAFAQCLVFPGRVRGGGCNDLLLWIAASSVRLDASLAR